LASSHDACDVSVVKGGDGDEIVVVVRLLAMARAVMKELVQVPLAVNFALMVLIAIVVAAAVILMTLAVAAVVASQALMSLCVLFYSSELN